MLGFALHFRKCEEQITIKAYAENTVFRASFMAVLRKKMSVAQHISKKVFQTKWVVYAKRPFASPKTVVEYLGRYSNNHTLSKRLHWKPWNTYVLVFLRPQKSMNQGFKNATKQSIRLLFNNFNAT
ncbi:transposase [Cyclobacterium amurskyense]|uniref:transposase n=1 Tax=Cyclobacterium amurskyense TaxID=320787 RepID=UPI00065E7190|nr:transposase [Cyclobacterium amurskyense]